jgi:hypothetical protein
MQAIIPLLEIMASSQDLEQRRLEELEAKAVDRAKANADAAFRPSPSILNAQSAAVLLQQVDGPSLQTYEGTESVYVGRSVPLAAGSKLNVPINVSTPGSVVEYAVELQYYDVEFSITAEREEGTTIVKVCQYFDDRSRRLEEISKKMTTIYTNLEALILPRKQFGRMDESLINFWI